LAQHHGAHIDAFVGKQRGQRHQQGAARGGAPLQLETVDGGIQFFVAVGGRLHQLRRAAPEIDFQAVNDRASCKYMKMITPAALLRCLVEGADEVDVDPETARRARASVTRMIEIGQPGGGE
jgi:quinolinate synthase